MRVSLPVRLFVSYAVVAAVGAVSAFVMVRLLAGRLFSQHLGMMGDGAHTGMGSMGMAGAQVQDAFADSLDRGLLVGLAASMLVAGAAAVLGTRRLLRPVEDVRAATRRIAAGDYASRVPLPSEPEMRALADDVNTLAATLAHTEDRRVRLLGDVAHEMRTPLTALDGYVEGMIDGVFPADPRGLAALGAEVRRLHRLADDLSALSRAQEDRLALAVAPCDLTRIATDAAARLRPQFDDAGIAVQIVAGDSVPVLADPDRVLQVVTNLLGNALVATPTGGTVTITVAAANGAARLAVTDTGVGLAAEDTERVFERFYRAPNATRRSAGSGVGLTIARGIARAHGGDLTAQSPGPDHGATFTLTLPSASG